MSEETFNYIKDKTRQVCRSCGSNYSDFFFADESGMCDECLVNTGHLGFTNLPANPTPEATKSAKETLERMSKQN